MATFRFGVNSGPDLKPLTAPACTCTCICMRTVSREKRLTGCDVIALGRRDPFPLEIFTFTTFTRLRSEANTSLHPF